MINLCYTKDRYQHIETCKITELFGNDLLKEQVLLTCEIVEDLGYYCPEITRFSDKVIMRWREEHTNISVTIYYKRHTTIITVDKEQKTLPFNRKAVKEFIKLSLPEIVFNG
jgi:hypothetical protein